MKIFTSFFSLLFVFLLSSSFIYAQCPSYIKISEFHYDNTGTDVNEFVEIELPAGTDPTIIQIDLYNGSDGTENLLVIMVLQITTFGIRPAFKMVLMVLHLVA